jgi:hypothetical protein
MVQYILQSLNGMKRLFYSGPLSKSYKLISFLYKMLFEELALSVSRLV